MSVSVVIPLYNERDNVQPLYDALLGVLPTLGREYEILFIDDGSRDGTVERLRSLAARDPRVRVIEFRRNFGQTAALQAGLDHASGDVLVTMDGDLQNDPADIPLLLAKLDEGYDLVHGWRKQRQDALVNRKIPSRIANWLIARVTGFPVHDLGCTLKALRREIARDLRLYGEMHRFIPILAHWHGARCAEIVTRHHARRFGQTKYGIGRTLRVVLDLLTVQFLTRYAASPMKLFGGLGLLGIGGGLASALVTLGMKLVQGVDMTGNPLLLLGVFGVTVGVQFLVLGLLGEVSTRIYHESQGKPPYAVRHWVNFAPAESRPGEPPLRRAA